MNIQRPGFKDAFRLARLAEDFEELLILVWKLEDEWALDERLNLASAADLRSPNRRGTPLR